MLFQLLLPVSDAMTCDDDGQTALMLAARNCDETAVELLLPVSDATARDNAGMTALDIAIYEGNDGCTNSLRRHLAKAEAFEIASVVDRAKHRSLQRAARL